MNITIAKITISFILAILVAMLVGSLQTEDTLISFAVSIIVASIINIKILTEIDKSLS